MKSLLMLLALSLPDGPTAREWATGLGSAKPDDRFATIDAIESRGMKALPVLREIVATIPGAVRTQAVELIERIGARRLLQPTLVRLDDVDRPVADAVKGLAADSGFAVEVDPGYDGRERKITARAGGSLPFFDALDRLGAASGLRHDLTPFIGSPNNAEVRVRLVASTNPPPPTSYAGPYKVVLRALERHREVVQTRTPAESRVREEFFAILDVVAEPGILIDRNGPAQIREAVDDRGQNLRTASADHAAATQNTRSWAMAELGQFSYRLPLNLPEGHGGKIAVLKGYLPITAFTRTDEMFSAPVAGLEGKALESGGVRVRFNRVTVGSNGGILDITVRGESTPDPMGLVFAPGPRQTGLTTLRQGFGPDDHLRIEDAQGRLFGCHANGTSPMSPDGTMNYRVTILTNPAAGPPAKIRYFGVAGVATEVPFEFRDLEIP